MVPVSTATSGSIWPQTRSGLLEAETAAVAGALWQLDGALCGTSRGPTLTVAASHKRVAFERYGCRRPLYFVTVP
jgi:hypothetical protein